MQGNKRIICLCLAICLAAAMLTAAIAVNAAPSYTAVTDWESYAVGAAGRQQIGILGSNTHTWTINPAIAGTDGVPGGGAVGCFTQLHRRRLLRGKTYWPEISAAPGAGG